MFQGSRDGGTAVIHMKEKVGAGKRVGEHAVATRKILRCCHVATTHVIKQIWYVQK